MARVYITHTNYKTDFSRLSKQMHPSPTNSHHLSVATFINGQTLRSDDHQRPVPPLTNENHPELNSGETPLRVTHAEAATNLSIISAFPQCRL